MKIRRLNTLVVTALTCLSLISFNSCKKDDVEDEIRPLKASFAEGTNTDGYVLIIKGDVMNIYKSYEATTNRISVVIEKDSDEVLKVDGLIQKNNEVVLNTEIVNAKDKDKIAEYDVQIDDFKYKIKISYQYTNFDKAIELIKDKRFVYSDFDISIMPSQEEINKTHKHFLYSLDPSNPQYNEDLHEAFKKLFGDNITYPSSILPDITKSKENYITFSKNIIKAEKTKSNNMEYFCMGLTSCPFYLNFKTSKLIEVQHWVSHTEENNNNTTSIFDGDIITFNNYAFNDKNQKVEFDNYMDFNYSLEKLDDENIIIRIDDEHLCSLGDTPQKNNNNYYIGYYISYYKDFNYFNAEKDNQPYHMKEIPRSPRTNKQESNYKGYRLVEDNYTNIILNTETGLISYEVDCGYDLDKTRFIIYLKAE